MHAALGPKGVEPVGREISPGQSAEMRPVVDARHQEPENQAREDPARGQLPQMGAAAPVAVMQDGAEQAEDPRGSADGPKTSMQESMQAREVVAGEDAGPEAHGSRHEIDAERARATVKVRERPP